MEGKDPLKPCTKPLIFFGWLLNFASRITAIWGEALPQLRCGPDPDAASDTKKPGRKWRPGFGSAVRFGVS